MDEDSQEQQHLFSLYSLCSDHTSYLSLFSFSLYLFILCISMSVPLHLSSLSGLSISLHVSLARLLISDPDSFSRMFSKHLCICCGYPCLSFFISLLLYLFSCLSTFLISDADSSSGTFAIKHGCHSSFAEELNTEHGGGGPFTLTARNGHRYIMLINVCEEVSLE